MSDILFLAHRVPFPLNRGDKIRSGNLLKKLASLGPVHVGCFAETAEDRAAASQIAAISASHCVVNRNKPLALAGAQAVLSGKPVSLTAFYSARLEDWVARKLEHDAIDTIVVFSGQMGQYVPSGFQGRVITDLCDVDSAKFEAYAADGERVWLNRREACLLAREEERIARRSDATLLISEAEAALLRSRLSTPHEARVMAMGNGIDGASFDPDVVTPHPDIAGSAGPHFIFTGQMDYRPNETAVLWALEYFLPLARARYPDAQLHIVGRAPTAALQARANAPGVRIWGEVADVKPFLAAATCALVPLQIARGVQNKVLEAMAMARPVLLTPGAATGIDALDGKHWMVAPPNAQTMLDRFAHLITEPGAGERMGRAARQFVLDHHDWDARLAPLDALLGSKARFGESRNAA
ncbi:MAG: TIGR03087 family PEP-CTERM/XrtA system glycosyltransferase [Pseudomonadota bacterium]